MLRSVALSLTALLFLALPVCSQTPDPSFYNNLRYRLVGPARGGRVTCVTGVPSEPRTFYMGVASGGLFRTIDAGATWTMKTLAEHACCSNVLPHFIDASNGWILDPNTPWSQIPRN